MFLIIRIARARLFRRVVVLLLCSAVYSANAGVYKWVDDDGNVHFGDRPSMHKDSSEVKIKKSPANNGGSSPQSAEESKDLRRKMLQVYGEERAAKQEAMAKKRAEACKREINCINARDELKNILDASSLYEPLAGGKRRVFSFERARSIHQPGACCRGALV